MYNHSMQRNEKEIVENPDEDTESFLSRVRLSHRVKIRARPAASLCQLPKAPEGQSPPSKATLSGRPLRTFEFS